MTDIQLEDIDFGAEMLNELAVASKARFRTDVWYRGFVSAAEYCVSKNETKRGLQFKLTIGMLEEEHDAGSVSDMFEGNYWLQTPWDLLAAPVGKEEADKRRNSVLVKRDMGCLDLHALCPDRFAEVPRSRGAAYSYLDGTVVSASEVETQVCQDRLKCIETLGQMVQDKDGSTVQYAAPYFQLEYQDGFDRPSIRNLRPALPAGEVFTSASQALIGDAPIVIPAKVNDSKKTKTKSSKRKK